MKLRSLFALLICCAVTAAFSADIYVSPAGNDEAEGTSPGSPLATIAKARDKADELKSGGAVTIHIMEGTYYLKEPLVIGSANSGKAEAPIVYKGYGKAVISGGILLPAATQWSSASINGVSVQKTTIDKNLHIDQLFLNGKRQIMARYPNFNWNTKILNGYANDAIRKGQSAANAAEGPGYIRALHTGGWGGESYYFTSNTAYQWVGDNNRGGAPHGTNQMAENIFEFLDAPGEWFYRKSTGELWFYPPQGTDMASAVIELASLTQLVLFKGSGSGSATSVKHVTFDNLVFTHTYRSLFDSTGQFYELITGSDWGIVRKAAVFMQNAEEIKIQNCLFDQLGGNGVFMSGYNRHCVVYNTEFKNTGASCVLLMGLRSSIRCPNKWNNAGNALAPDPCNDRTPGPLTQDYPAYCVVENCLMDTLGIFEKQVSGINFSASEFDTIRHNSMAHMPRAGINFCDGCWGGHIVEYNWVYDVVRETSDHGPFNAWGRDRNAIYGSNDRAATYYDARNATIVRMNRFETPDHMFGIDLDDQASNYYQEKNLVLGGGFKVQWTRGNKYINNISLATNNGNVQFHGTWGSASQPSDHHGAHNIIYATSTCVYQFCCGSNPSQVAGTKTIWDTNMVYTTAGQPNCSDWNNCGSGNYSWQQWTSAGMDVHSTIADPQWVDKNKKWTGRVPEYLPVGDFNPSNTTAINAINFKTFPMDSFGIVGTVPGPDFSTTVGVPHQTHRHSSSDKNKVTMSFNGGVLKIGCKGDYQVSIISPAGRTVTRFSGTGSTNYIFDAKQIKPGMYFALIRAKLGMVSKRFLVSR
ncbi:MAG: hypothetical protein JW863_19855 [Chitinispirillaceae bacterium]|nr:hypothetical protein [Chitinispirillaceae bacterium]